MEDKDQIIKDLKAELYDLNKGLNANNALISQVAEIMGVTSVEGLIEAAQEYAESKKTPEDTPE